jgi:sec-independent protein translocase protein TatA
VGALQPGHLVVILVIVLIIFGPGKLSELSGQLGQGIREFRDGSERKDGTPALSSAARYCMQCGSTVAADASFCDQCGRPLDGAA